MSSEKYVGYVVLGSVVGLVGYLLYKELAKPKEKKTYEEAMIEKYTAYQKQQIREAQKVAEGKAAVGKAVLSIYNNTPSNVKIALYYPGYSSVIVILPRDTFRVEVPTVNDATGHVGNPVSLTIMEPDNAVFKDTNSRRKDLVINRIDVYRVEVVQTVTPKPTYAVQPQPPTTPPTTIAPTLPVSPVPPTAPTPPPDKYFIQPVGAKTPAMVTPATSPDIVMVVQAIEAKEELRPQPVGGGGLPWEVTKVVE